ncbi:MAG: amidohydrolase family protein [Burkholderiales bacterium]
MDLMLRNARVLGRPATERPVDIGIRNGKIEIIAHDLTISGRDIDLGGRFVTPSFCESHIHLDKSCILDRCQSQKGDLEEAIREVAAAKKTFTAEDVYGRARGTLEKSISHGTGFMRTHVEVDPGIGLRGLDGILQAVKDHAWAMDIEVCVFPQEGLTNNPGTEELMRESLKRGARVVGAAPYTDTDPHGQIDRVFKMARDFDADIDMHLDFGATPDTMDVEYVCEQAEKHQYGGRVAVGHVTKLSLIPPAKLDEISLRLADAGVAVTVLPSTDLYLMSRDHDHKVPRGVTPAHRLLKKGVNCSLSTNNVLNPFTPFGDCSLTRMANLYANIAQAGSQQDIRECFEMVTRRSAQLLRLPDYGVEVGRQADLVVLDCTSAEQAVAELAPPLYGFKRGRMTFSRAPVQLYRP